MYNDIVLVHYWHKVWDVYAGWLLFLLLGVLISPVCPVTHPPSSIRKLDTVWQAIANSITGHWIWLASTLEPLKFSQFHLVLAREVLVSLSSQAGRPTNVGRRWPPRAAGFNRVCWSKFRVVFGLCHVRFSPSSLYHGCTATGSWCAPPNAAGL